MIQDNMDFLDMEYYGSDYDLDSFHLAKDEIEFISIPAWRTEDGTLVAIRDMVTPHIKNCIRKIYKSNCMWRRKYLRYFMEELYKRKKISIN